MTVVPQGNGGAVSTGSGGSGNLYDVLELVLDRGLVIDAFARVSLVGIELVKIDARVVVASVDTYLRFAEACNRLDLEAGRKAPAQLSDIVEDTTEGGARGKSKGALTGAVQAVTESLQKGHDDERDERRSGREKQHERAERGSGRRSSKDREE
ncbi:gas vesicle structural protein GvpA [Streptomyces sp. B93]|uniref:gas vesicle structural protein GvpA n=1 Tax=Streptomyces sp. B93 TaxID=2824875 RepID=UPI001B36C552|nr:gas vesicle structural protein GvpA [Streptomyces sp. B93]MBQ1090708.1 gas vesicle structural protein GvpA [Streptomyces sp. B93]